MRERKKTIQKTNDEREEIYKQGSEISLREKKFK
jgi:hypothetical protein